MKLPILQVPDERLRRVAAAVDFSDFTTVEVKLPNAIDDMRETFAATAGCVGLAATQLGIELRVIIFDTTKSRSQTCVMVNPVVVKASEDTQSVRDGCMSIDHGRRFVYTRRPKRIEVEWQDAAGGKHWQKYNGLLAAVIHHEIDHLNGVLFTDKLASSAVHP